MKMNWRDERRLEQEQRDRDYEAREEQRESLEAAEAIERAAGEVEQIALDHQIVRDAVEGWMDGYMAARKVA